MKALLRWLLCFQTLSSFGLVSVSAQAVVVQVIQEESGLPVPGAFLTFLREDGTVIRSALTSPEGRFLFRSEVAGEVTIRAEMIGREAVEESGVTLREGSTTTVHIRLPINAIPLTGIQVRGEERCRLRPDEASEIFLVWEEARKALRAQEWTERTELYRYQIVSYDRNLDPDSHRVLSEDRRVKSSITQSPFQSLPPEQLLREGFIHPLDGGGYEYFAPDATVLLSDLFLDTHCFRLQASPDDPRKIGLSFEPVQVTDRPEIAGTFWLDRETASLQFLEFRYTWAPQTEARGVAGGRVEFQGMPNGAWIVKRWWLRMPRMGRLPVISRTDWSGVRLAGIKESGAEITRAELVDQGRFSEVEPGAVGGVVWDSVRSVPLPDAQVYLSGTEFSTQTDSLGRFLLEGLPEGFFTAAFEHPRLDSLGVPANGIGVEVLAGSLTEVSLGAPSWPTVLAFACGEGAERRSFVVTGEVRDLKNGDPIPGADVRLEWEGAQDRIGGVYRTREHWFTTQTNEAGRYRACGIPLDEVIEVQASFSGRDSKIVRLRAPEADFEAVNLELDLGPGTASDHPESGGEQVSGASVEVLSRRPGPTQVVGKVIDVESQRPVPGSTIVVKDSLGQVLVSASGNEAGNFQFSPQVSGTYQLQVSSVGYAAIERAIVVFEDQMLTVRVPLHVQPVELEGIEASVQATPRHGGMAIAGFRARQAAGIGTFYDEADIEHRRPSRITDIVSRAPGMNVLLSGGRAVDVSTGRSQGGLRRTDQCLPDLWLDGVKVREGGYLSARVGMATFLNDLIQPEAVGGIEVYSGVSQIPAQFRGTTSMCGVVVIWSRRGEG